MSKQDKLVKKLLSKPKDFTWDELVKLLSGFDYMLENKGKTSGSAVAFYAQDGRRLYMHKPHPKKILKGYQVKAVIEELKSVGLI